MEDVKLVEGHTWLKAATKAQWEADMRDQEKHERLKAARKAGRESERKKYKELGYVLGVVSAAGFFLRQDRYSADIAKLLLKYFCVNRKRATDTGLGDYELSRLDKADAWSDPPPELTIKGI